MKKIIQILLVCSIIIGIIVTVSVGFNVGTKYSENTQIGINIGKEFKESDIRVITDEVFKGQTVLIQPVELYKDMLLITVEEATDEQISELNTKINEKYEIETNITDLEIIHNQNVRLRTIVKPYIVPVVISVVLITAYAMIVYRKLGVWQVLYKTAIRLVGTQAVLFSICAITRIPVNRVTSIISITVFIVVTILNMISLQREKNQIGEKIN